MPPILRSAFFLRLQPLFISVYTQVRLCCNQSAFLSSCGAFSCKSLLSSAYLSLACYNMAMAIKDTLEIYTAVSELEHNIQVERLFTATVSQLTKTPQIKCMKNQWCNVHTTMQASKNKRGGMVWRSARERRVWLRDVNFALQSKHSSNVAYIVAALVDRYILFSIFSRSFSGQCVDIEAKPTARLNPV